MGLWGVVSVESDDNDVSWRLEEDCPIGVAAAVVNTRREVIRVI